MTLLKEKRLFPLHHLHKMTNKREEKRKKKSLTNTELTTKSRSYQPKKLKEKGKNKICPLIKIGLQISVEIEV